MSDYDETREIGAKAFAEVFQDAYQQGKRDGIKQGLLRAAEICDYHDNADDQGYGAWKAAAAIRAEAEKEGK